MRKSLFICLLLTLISGTAFGFRSDEAIGGVATSLGGVVLDRDLGAFNALYNPTLIPMSVMGTYDYQAAASFAPNPYGISGLSTGAFALTAAKEGLFMDDLTVGAGLGGILDIAPEGVSEYRFNLSGAAYYTGFSGLDFLDGVGASVSLKALLYAISIDIPASYTGGSTSAFGFDVDVDVTANMFDNVWELGVLGFNLIESKPTFFDSHYSLSTVERGLFIHSRVNILRELAIFGSYNILGSDHLVDRNNFIGSSTAFVNSYYGMEASFMDSLFVRVGIAEGSLSGGFGLDIENLTVNVGILPISGVSLYYQLDVNYRVGDWVKMDTLTVDSTLSSAVAEGDLETVVDMLARDADTGNKDSDGYYPIPRAVDNYFIAYDENGSFDEDLYTLIELLVDDGSYIDQWDLDGYTPLQRAAEYGNLDLMELLIENGATVDLAFSDGSGNAMGVAAENGQIEALNLLIENGAVEYLDAMYLAEAKLDEVAGTETADKVKEAIRILAPEVYATADADAVECMIAAIAGEWDSVQSYLDGGVSADLLTASEESLLHLAAYDNEVAMVQTLLDLGVAVDVVQDENLQPLTYAVMGGAVDAAKLLIANGADSSIEDNYDNTLLHEAMENDRLEMAKYLVEDLGLDVNAEGSLKRTPLFSAVYGRASVEIVQYLVSQGADPEEDDKLKDTPYDVASEELITAQTYESDDTEAIERLEALKAYFEDPDSYEPVSVEEPKVSDDAMNTESDEGVADEQVSENAPVEQ